MKRILFQGDSLTDCSRDRENSYNKGCGYVTMVSGSLGADFPGEYEFINRGVGGNKIVDLMSRVEYDVIDLKPDYLSVLLGGNDIAKEVMYRTDPGAKRFETLYNLYIEEIRGSLPDVKIMLLGTCLFKGPNTEKQYDEYIEQAKIFNAATERVAQKHNLVYVPLLEVMQKASETAPDSYWSYDGWHPHSCGHEIIKREWLKGFEKLK